MSARGVIHGFFVSVGNNHFINALDVLAIIDVSKASAPILRLMQETEENNIILTNGKRAKSLILLNSGLFIRSVITSQVIAARINEAMENMPNKNITILRSKLGGGKNGR